MRRLAVAIGLLLAAVAVGGTALAHSGLGAASPAPGSLVGGEITDFQLRYSSTVEDVDGSFTDPNGDVVESTWEQTGNLSVTVSLAAPLSVPGQYVVRHVSTDVEDTDRVEADYRFTYEPAAPPPQLEIIPEADGFPWIMVVIGVGITVIALLLWQLFRSMQLARRRRPTT